jgi:dTMP kinase
MSGKLIVIEGIDGAGTTTQTRGLALELERRGKKVLVSAEPTKSPLGQEIRRMLAMPIAKDHEMLVALALSFAADRMQHIYLTIMPALKTHDYVLLDRYVLSSMVYQGLHLPSGFIKEINQYAVKPHMTFVIDIDAHVAFERLSMRAQPKDFYESLEFLEKLKERYLHFAQKEENIVLIDGEGSVEQVQSYILHILDTDKA